MEFVLIPTDSFYAEPNSVWWRKIVPSFLTDDVLCDSSEHLNFLNVRLNEPSPIGSCIATFVRSILHPAKTFLEELKQMV